MSNETKTTTKAVQTQTTQTAVQRSGFETAVISAKPTFVQMYGEGAKDKFLKEYGFAAMQARKNPRLNQCKPDSVKNALIQVALTDLTLNPHLNYAYLIPRGSECTLDIDYKYMIDLMIKNGIVEAVDAGVIFQGEKYEYTRGTNAVFSHTPDLMLEDDSQNNAIAAYMIAYLNGHKLPFVLRRNEILSRKNVSKSHSVWNGEFWQSMWIKTVIRYAYKFLPKSARVDQVMSVLNENDILTEEKPAEIIID